jgi:hypothetical protein
MPDLRKVSGVPLPANDVAAGTVSVRVVRGSFANNLAGVSVDFVVDGRTRTVKTDDAGRAEVKGLAPGARLKAVAVVNGERLETQEITIGQTGVRFVLAATDPDAVAREAENRSLAAGPAVTGSVVLGSGSRIVAQFDNDRLFVFYVLSVLNTARTPVDIGGPLNLDLPKGARGAAVIEESSSQAAARGERVVVTGPFAPGTTRVNVRFELPYSGPVARLSQTWPATLQELQVFALKTGDLDVRSPQIKSKQSVMQEGLPVVVASGPAIARGQTLELEITGLPYHAQWPRYLALGAAGTIVLVGLWAGFAGRRRD